MCHRKLFHLTLWSTVLPFLFLLLCSVLIDEAIAENGAGSCGEALARCETSESCKWHIGDVRVRCAMTGNCVREKCAEAIRRFVKFVERPLVESLSLCSCPRNAETCPEKASTLSTEQRPSASTPVFTPTTGTKRERFTTTILPPAKKEEEPLPPWITTTSSLPTTTTEFITHPPPPPEGCELKDPNGRPLFFHVGSIFRKKEDWAGRCSSWCECVEESKMECQPLSCLPDGECEAELSSMEFGERLYVRDRGVCMCDVGGFVCESSATKPEFYPGVYLLVGYSIADINLLRKELPEHKLEEAGLLSAHPGRDIAGQLQIAFERLLPQGVQCRLVVMEEVSEEGNLVLRVQWYGMLDVLNQTTPQWQNGFGEKVCSPHVARLTEMFEMNSASRLQLILSTVRQLRLVDMLNGIPASLSAPHSSSLSLCVFLLSIIIFIFFGV